MKETVTEPHSNDRVHDVLHQYGRLVFDCERLPLCDCFNEYRGDDFHRDLLVTMQQWDYWEDSNAEPDIQDKVRTLAQFFGQTLCCRRFSLYGPTFTQRAITHAEQAAIHLKEILEKHYYEGLSKGLLLFVVLLSNFVFYASSEIELFAIGTKRPDTLKMMLSSVLESLRAIQVC